MVGSADSDFNGFPTLPIVFGAKPENGECHWLRTLRPPATTMQLRTPPLSTMDLKHTLRDFCMNPRHTRWVAALLILGDAVLCALIIWKVPCELSIMF